MFFSPYDISFEYDSEKGFYNLQKYFSCVFVFVSFVLCIALNDRSNDLIPFFKKLGLVFVVFSRRCMLPKMLRSEDH